MYWILIFFLILILLPISFLIGLYYHALILKEKKVKIVVAENNGGQLCNQLFHFARLIAFCKERGYELYNIPFVKYACFFEHFRKDLLLSSTNSVRLPRTFANLIRRRAYRIFRHLLTFRLQKNRCYFNDEKNPTVLDNNYPQLANNTYLFFNWNFENAKGMEKYRKEIVNLFKPHKPIQQAIENFWAKIDKDRLTVGVHMRHGDFRKWRQGMHFYSVEQTYAYMKEISYRYQALRPLFIIYSNEPRNASEFASLDVLISNQSNIVDLYSMARCHLIMGARISTFNEWAAWYGNVPRFFFGEENDWNALDTHIKFSKQQLSRDSQ